MSSVNFSKINKVKDNNLWDQGRTFYQIDSNYFIVDLLDYDLKKKKDYYAYDTITTRL